MPRLYAGTDPVEAILSALRVLENAEDKVFAAKDWSKVGIATVRRCKQHLEAHLAALTDRPVTSL